MSTFGVRGKRRGQAGFTLVETLVAVAISAIIVGPVGAWLVLSVTAQAPAAAGLTESGESRILTTYFTSDIASAEAILANETPADPPTDFQDCSGASSDRTLLNIYDSSDPSTMLAFGVADPDGDNQPSFFRWECEIKGPNPVLAGSIELVRNVLTDPADTFVQCTDERCSTVDLTVTVAGGFKTSIKATARQIASDQSPYDPNAPLAGFGGASPPLVSIEEKPGTFTPRSADAPMSVELTGKVIDSDSTSVDTTWKISDDAGNPIGEPESAELALDPPPSGGSGPRSGETTQQVELEDQGQYTVTLAVFDGFNKSVHGLLDQRDQPRPDH